MVTLVQCQSIFRSNNRMLVPLIRSHHHEDHFCLVRCGPNIYTVFNASEVTMYTPNSSTLYNLRIIIIILMAGMAVFYVAGYLIEERRRWPVITASPRGQCSNSIK